LTHELILTISKLTKHIENITWSQLNCQNDQLYALDRTLEGRIASCSILTSSSMFTQSVMVSKIGVVLHQGWSESQWDTLLSQEMLDAVKCIADNDFIQCTGASCIQYSPTAAVEAQLPFSSATAP